MSTPGADSTATPRAHVPPDRRAWVVLLVVAALALMADLVTKDLAFRHIADVPVQVRYSDVLAITHPDPPAPGEPAPPPAARSLSDLIPWHRPVTVIPSVLELKLVLNPGAVFGLGAGKRVFFIAFTAVAMGVAILIFWRGTGPRDRLAHVCLGLLIAGGLGNLYDRVVHGCVRDFLHPLPGVKFPGGLRLWGNSGEVWPWVSNVADAFLIVGILGLVVHLWRDGRRQARDQQAARPQPTP